MLKSEYLKLFQGVAGHFFKSYMTVEERWKTLHERNKQHVSRHYDTERETRILDEAYPHTEVGNRSTGNQPGTPVQRDPLVGSLARSPPGIPSCGWRHCCRTSGSHAGAVRAPGRTALQGQHDTQTQKCLTKPMSWSLVVFLSYLISSNLIRQNNLKALCAASNGSKRFRQTVTPYSNSQLSHNDVNIKSLKPEETHVVGNCRNLVPQLNHLFTIKTHETLCSGE